MTPESRLRELIREQAEFIQKHPDSGHDALHASDKILSLLDQMGGERTWKAGETIAEWVWNGDAHRATYTRRGDIAVYAYVNGTWHEQSWDVKRLAALYGVPVTISAEGWTRPEGHPWDGCAFPPPRPKAAEISPPEPPKTEPPAFGDGSGNLSATEFDSLRPGMSLLDSKNATVAEVIMAPREREDGKRVVGLWYAASGVRGTISGNEEFYRPATIETAIALNRLPAPTEAVAEGEKGEELRSWIELADAIIESWSEDGEFNCHGSEYSVPEIREMAVVLKGSL